MVIRLADITQQCLRQPAMPSSPQVETGRIHRMTVNHGFVVYVTETEFRHADFVLNKFFYFGFICFGVFAILKTYWKKR
jgi:hypothetical protein